MCCFLMYNDNPVICFPVLALVGVQLVFFPPFYYNHRIVYCKLLVLGTIMVEIPDGILYVM